LSQRKSSYESDESYYNEEDNEEEDDDDADDDTDDDSEHGIDATGTCHFNHIHCWLLSLLCTATITHSPRL
jgi:hypothetical protein